MSFSSNVKEELSKINNWNKKNELIHELVGYFISKNTTRVDNMIRFATESEYNINRYSKILKNLDIEHDIEIEGKSFVIVLKIRNIINKSFCINEMIEILHDNIVVKDINNNINDYEKKAIIRGSFLGSGSINNPENTYHMEINLSNKINLEYLYIIAKEMGIAFKKLEQDEKYSLYIKEGEEISTLLALMGANKAVLDFQNIRVEREMRGKVNRIVNCKTANLNKIINASVEQIEAIKKLQESNQFNMLDDNLKEIAILRLENPDMPLIELGKILKKPIGKSGVNYRLKKIIDLANEL